MRKYLKPKSAYRMKIGRHIRMWRDIKGIKQHELAARIGITAAALSQIENDIAQLTLHRVEDIADALELKPEQLFTSPQLIHRAESTMANTDLLQHLVTLMENMNNYFAGKPK